MGIAVVTRNQPIASEIYSLELLEPALAAACRPGQFVMAAMSEDYEPFLRRPFGVAGFDPDQGALRLIYRVTGKGSAQMARWQTGRQVDLLGPLGNGFSWDTGCSRALLAGGSLGAAPLLPLAQELRRRGVEVTAFLGAKSLDLLFGSRQLAEYGCQVHIATEDGSAGVPGLLTLPLEGWLKKNLQKETDRTACRLFACGSMPFLKAVADLSAEYALETQVSLEERMGCGFGACMGCAVPVRQADGSIRQLRVCTDGPVFAAGEVIFHG